MCIAVHMCKKIYKIINLKSKYRFKRLSQYFKIIVFSRLKITLMWGRKGKQYVCNILFLH